MGVYQNTISKASETLFQAPKWLVPGFQEFRLRSLMEAFKLLVQQVKCKNSKGIEPIFHGHLTFYLLNQELYTSTGH